MSYYHEMSPELRWVSWEPSVILLCTFPNACELFSQLDIKFLERRDHSLNILDIQQRLTHCEALNGMLLKFSIHQDDHRDPENLKDLRERKKKSKVFIKVQAPLNRMTEK